MQPLRSLRIPLLRDAGSSRELGPAPAAAGGREDREQDGERDQAEVQQAASFQGVAVKPQIDAAPSRGNTLAGESQLPGAALDG